MTIQKTTRREAITVIGTATTALLLGEKGFAKTMDSEKTKKSKKKSKRVLRIAHLTDIHVQPEKKADQGMIECLKQVHSMKDKPDIIFNGGDMIMDSLGTGFERTKLQWDLWNQILKDYCEIPIIHCIGNHDVWGWNKKESGCTGEEPLYGKKYVMEQCGLMERYFSFNQAGWHFVVLDSTHTREGHTYTAKLDEEQFEWLSADLENVPSDKPILILSHIPILCGCAFMDGENETTGEWTVPGAWMHIDARRIKDLFLKYPNIKLCLSGHIHLLDRLDYNGITYLCNGSVCGNWWKGNYQETPPGYALIDLYSDSSFQYQYIQTGWIPQT